MGDKISQLPSATSVDGTELVPIVQGGATKKVTGDILRSPVGAASGDLTGNYPNPSLAAVTTGQSNVGGPMVIPVLTTDSKGRVTALTTVASPALTTNQLLGLSTEQGAALATVGVVGLSQAAARADHQHPYPTASQVGALAATAVAGGDLVGNYPNPTLASVTTAQNNVGGSSQIPVLSIDAKGRVTALSSVAAAVTTTVGGDLTGALPNPSLVAVTTAQNNVGSNTQVPVLSIDAKGRVTSLSSVPISGTAGGTVTSITAGDGLSGGTITGSGTIAIASVTTAQSNVGSGTQIPVLSINDKGQITSLTSVPAAASTTTAGGDLTGAYPSPSLVAITTAQSQVGSASAIPVISTDAKGRVTSLTTVAFAALTTNQIAGLTTAEASALATTGVAGLSSFAARSDHQHPYPTAAQVGALGATAAAGGDLAGNFPSPTLAAITTAQSNTGSSSSIPVLSIDAKGRVTALTTAANIASGSAGGDLTGTFPNPTLSAITTAQSNVGSATQIPVLSIDAKGRVTALSSVAAQSANFIGISYLIAAGGGGGTAGGGGAGGLLQGLVPISSGQVCTVVVGAGGAGASTASATAAANGSDSSFYTINATGGGGGGPYTATIVNGSSGGSGGGGGYGTSAGINCPGGLGAPGQGRNGGRSYFVTGFGGVGGGGGGAGAVGASASSGAGANGGVGISSSITGSAVFYCGGGGSGGNPLGTGGSGGGGNGTNYSPFNGGATSGTANTGGGAGGGTPGFADSGANGGSGVVILSIPTSAYTGITTGSPTVTTSGLNTILRFTSSGSYTA